jgi:hypothetical protein
MPARLAGTAKTVMKPPALQIDADHQEDQRDGLDQRVYDLARRLLDEDGLALAEQADAGT